MPHSEGTDSIILKAKNPNNNNKEIGSYTITGKFYYDSLTVSYTKQSDVSYADNTKTAYWSKFANDAITLGDGEKMTFKFSVSEAKTKDLTITAALQTKKNGNISLANGATTGQFILSHNSDSQVPAYKITTGYKPTYKGSASYPDGTPIKMSDFYSFRIRTVTITGNGFRTIIKEKDGGLLRTLLLHPMCTNLTVDGSMKVPAL